MAARERRIACQGCELRFSTIRSNTKLCHLCRLRRDLVFLDDAGSAVKRCRDCGDFYARSHAKDYRCADDAGAKWTPGACMVCQGHTEHLHHPTVPICQHCLKDPAQRPQLLRTLTTIRNRRREDLEPEQELADWQHACVEAAKQGDDPPPRPDELQSAGLDAPKPVPVPDDWTDFAVEVVWAAHDHWGGFVVDGFLLGVERDFGLDEAIAFEGRGKSRPAVLSYLRAHAALRPPGVVGLAEQRGAPS